MKKIFDMIQSKSNTIKLGTFNNENIFKAIQSRLMNSKGSKVNLKEGNTPTKSGKKKSGGFTQRTGSFKSTKPVNSYNTSAFSPRSITSGRKERETIYSPVSMKSYSKKSKKSSNKHKNSASRKRDSIGGNNSKNYEDFTMFSTRNKPLFKYNK